MKYKIPKSTIRSFIDVLREIKRNLESINKDTLKEKENVSIDFLISDEALKSKDEEEKIKLKYDLCNLVLEIIKKLQIAIDKLIRAYEQGELKEYIPFFDVIVACLGTQNEFVAMIILDVIKNNAKYNIDKNNAPLEIKMASLIEEYQIKGDGDELTKLQNTNEFLQTYAMYLANAHQVIKYLTGEPDDFKQLNRQVEFMKSSLNSLPTAYAAYLKTKQKKNEYVLSLTPVYTENNEVKYYMDNGKVLHLCDPKTFNELLIKQGYSDNARYSMLKKMIKDIKNSSTDEAVLNREKLVGDTLAMIGLEYFEKWKYVSQKKKYYSYDILEDFYKYFYMVPEIDEGYGFTSDDIIEFMKMELEIVYERMTGKTRKITRKEF